MALAASSRQQKRQRTKHAIFEERRMLSGHLFFTPDLAQWHLFYFDQRDFAERKNHWEGGSHIHLINHLWPGRTAQAVWDQFCTGNPQMTNALHIKFFRRPRDPMPPNSVREDSLDSGADMVPK
jgi:hypothetical protein